jgi:arginyl-tRNA synthetase
MINNYKKYFAEILKKQTEIDIDEITKNITIVPENISGDLSFPCFQLSKVLKKSPNDISKDLAEKLSTDDHFTKFEAIGGFLNAHIDQSSFVSSFFSSTDTSYNNEDQKVLIEYMSANPNKPLHI